MSITVGILLSALAASDAAAQWNFARFETNRSRVYTTFGLDPAFVSSVGLARVGSLLDHAIQISGEVGVATARTDTRDFRTRLGVQTSLVRWRSLHIAGSALAVVRGTENTVFKGYSFGADFTGTAGVYRPRWFAAGEFGKDKAVIAKVTHSDWYRTVYPGAKDGWYLNAGGTFHYGLSGGVALGRTEVLGRVGMLKTERFNDMLPPMYASVGMGVGF